MWVGEEESVGDGEGGGDGDGGPSARVPGDEFESGA